MATNGTAGTVSTGNIDSRTDEEPRSDGKHVPHDSALSVGVIDGQDNVIRGLENEVKQLAERITADSLRFAEYENEIRVLQAQLRQEKRRNIIVDTQISSSRPTTPISRPQPTISRFGSFIGSRKPATPTSPDREKELETALIQERTQRLAAEKKVTEVNEEIEELSATLFQQANEMVSSERREKAELKERVRLLEERDIKTCRRLEALEQREIDRKRRMEMLENAIKRIETARALLVPQASLIS